MRSRQEQLHEDSLKDPVGFWGKAAENVSWFEPWDRVFDDSGAAGTRWFRGGRLNSCYNALDLHVQSGRSGQPALIYDSPVTKTIKTFTYADLLDEVSRFAGVLTSFGVTKGDRVIIYMPMVPETAIAMLACARIGAIHSVVFGGFAPRELATRINDATPKVILSASCGIETNRIIPYKPLLDQAISMAFAKPQACIIYQRPQLQAPLTAGLDFDWSALSRNADPVACVPVESNDPLYVLYTSGTTGIPKGVVRDNGGHLVALKWSMQNVYGAGPRDVYWAASDMGWAVGHSYIVYGPLFQGCTTILYEGKPVGTPDPGAFWRVVEAHSVHTLFTAPTAFRAIKREDPDGKYLLRHDLTSLRTLFLAGERCDPDTLSWAHEKLAVPVIDHWWQTETGWPVACNCVGLGRQEIKPGSCARPVPGYDVRILDDGGDALPPGTSGNVAIRLPLPPGCLATLWQNSAGYEESYLSAFPGYYSTADAGYQDEDGYLWIMGRTDDIINVAGHRLSTGSIEEVLASHPDVAECAVVGVADALKGEVPLGIVVVKKGVTRSPLEIETELIQMVRQEIGAVVCFRAAAVVKRLPKTRSGKILRRIVKKIAEGKDYAVPATIDDPEILTEIAEALAALGYPSLNELELRRGGSAVELDERG